MTRQHDSDKDDETRQAHSADAAHADNTAASSADRTNHNDTLTPDDNTAEALKAVANVPHNKKGRAVTWGVGAGIIVVLIGGLVWGVQRQQMTQQQLDQLSSELSALRNNSLARSALDQTVAPLNERLQTLSGSVDALQKRLAENHFADGRYIEIDYQLRMALQRLSLNGDVHGALELLKSTDQRLAELNEPAFMPVRNAIHDAMAHLGNISAPDIEGLYLQLAAESHAVDALKMAKELPAAAKDGAGNTESQSEQRWWRRELANIKQGLKDLVVVRYNNQNIDELLMPEQESAIREHIRLGFSEAQAGLLRQSPDIYTHALQGVVDTIRRYFPQDDEGVKQLLLRLDALPHHSIRPELPDINGVLTQWQQVLEHRQAQQGA